MPRRFSAILVLILIFLLSVNSFADEKHIKEVAGLVKDRLEWSGFWFGQSRMGLPYGQKLNVLIKDKSYDIYDVVINHPLNIPGFHGEIVAFNTYMYYNGILVEQNAESSFLKVPEELDEFKSEGAIYSESIVLNENWRPVQGDDSISTRFLDEILYDADKYFTARRDSFPALVDAEEVKVIMNIFSGRDREVYMLPEGIDQVFIFKVHQPFPIPEQQHCFWDQKDIRFFNKDLLRKIKEFGKEYTINIGDDYPIAKGIYR